MSFELNSDTALDEVNDFHDIDNDHSTNYEREQASCERSLHV